MSRLIDANELERAAMGLGEDVVCDGCFCEFMDLIDKQPTIEAVNVVRCSECQYWQPPTYAEQEDGSTVGHCTAALDGQQTDACWFCADGTR